MQPSSSKLESPVFPILSYKTALENPEEFIRSLQSALLHSGFFYLTDISSEIEDWQTCYDDLFDTSRGFFALDNPKKDKIAMINSRHFRGYSGVGEEVTKGKVDLREQIDLGPETEPYIPYPAPAGVPVHHYLYGPNLYPVEDTPAFRPSIEAYRHHVLMIAQTLIALIALSLTHKPEILTHPFSSDQNGRTPGYSRMKVVHYPPVEPKETTTLSTSENNHDSLGVGAHKDGGGLTLLAQDSLGGLQVQLWTGLWVDVKPIPYSLVINVGQVIERISSGAYRATTHRVLANTRSKNKGRISIPFFYSPTLLSTLTQLTFDQLRPEVIAVVEGRKDDEVSEVKKGDLHEEEFGRAAWRGITRSHGEVWRKYYGELDTVGGPEAA